MLRKKTGKRYAGSVGQQGHSYTRRTKEEAESINWAGYRIGQDIRAVVFLFIKENEREDMSGSHSGIF